jgi:UDP:flavonoid glycosyltransferase YjiC (YdhE family)
MEWIYRLIEHRFASTDTILVAPPMSFGARLAQEKLGLPLVTLNVETTNFRTSHVSPGRDATRFLLPIELACRRALDRAIDRWLLDPLLLPRVNGFRAKLGLAPILHAWRDWPHSPLLTIGLFPEWFAPCQPDWPPQVRLTGFPLFDEQREIPPAASRFLETGEPPIIFYLGTGLAFAEKFFNVSTRACVQLHRRGLLLTPHRHCVPSTLPESVVHFEYVPLGAVLFKAAALVHHGGIGTMAQGFRSGTPQLIMPVFIDQPENAKRLVQLGAGEAIRPREYSVDNATRALTRLLTSPEISAKCRAIAARFERSDAIGDTCQLIESVAPQSSTGKLM